MNNDNYVNLYGEIISLEGLDAEELRWSTVCAAGREPSRIGVISPTSRGTPLANCMMAAGSAASSRGRAR